MIARNVNLRTSSSSLGKTLVNGILKGQELRESSSRHTGCDTS